MCIFNFHFKKNFSLSLCFSIMGEIWICYCVGFFFSPQRKAVSILPFIYFFTRNHNSTVIKSLVINVTFETFAMVCVPPVK